MKRWPQNSLRSLVQLIVLFGLLGVECCQSAGNVAAWGYYYDLTMPETYRPMYVPATLTNVVAVSGGAYHAVALKSDGRVVVWGDPISSSANVPTDLTNAVAIAAGFHNTFALRANGTVVAWGSGVTSVVAAGLSNVVAIAAGSSHCLALKADGTVVAWGSNLNGAATVPWGLSGVVQIAAGRGDFASLALKEDGTVVAWGSAASWTNVPPGLTNVVGIAGGSFHCLALKEDGTVVAWGDNSSGQTAVPLGLTNVVSVAAAFSHSLALKADGTVVSWGLNNYGQTNVPTTLTNVAAVAGGGTFSLAIQGDGSPFLIQPLHNRKVAESTRIEFRIAASGTPPLKFQWKFYGTNLPDATNDALVIPEVMLRHSGAYEVEVTNVLGAVSSTNQLEVIPILIAGEPQSQFAYMGGTTSFGVAAEGRAPLLYQWKFNGVNLIGQTNSSLQLTNLRLVEVGDYSVAISNSIGYAQSQTVHLSLSQVAVWGDGQTIPQGWTNISAIAAGAEGSLVLRANGTLAATGFFVTNGLPYLNDVIAIAAGGKYADGGCGMALRSNGTVVVWGDTRYNQQIVPSGLSNVVAISVGGHHCLALRADGTVSAWGWNGYGQASIPDGLGNAVAVAGGYDHSLILLADGRLVSLGNIGLPPAGLTNVVAIAAGYYHQMALRSDGTVVAWGGNFSGQANVPAGLSNVVAIAAGAGAWHSLALKQSGEVVVWGGNDKGQMNAPAPLPKATSISGGGAHSLALVEGELASPFLNERLSNRAIVAGSPAYFRVTATGTQPISYQWFFNGLALDSQTNSVLALSPGGALAGTYTVVVSNAFGVVTTSGHLDVIPMLITQQPQSQSTYVGFPEITFTVGVTGQQPYTYQWQHDGVDVANATNSTLTLNKIQLADAGTYSVLVSNPVAFVKSIDAVLQVHRVVPWGLYRVRPTNTLAVTGIAGSHRDSLAVTSNGNVIVWATEIYGKTNVPPGLSNVVSVAGGEFYCMALRSNGTVVAWGNNSYGERNVPPDLSNVVAIAAGYIHGLALKSDGTVIAWGNNTYNQKSVPFNLSNVVSIAGGCHHSLALRSDGSVVAWGNNSAGQTNVPSFLTNVVGVAGGAEHSLALLTDGTVFAWGKQTGSPPGLSNVIAIECGNSHNLALRADGTVVAWGSNSRGQSGVPSWLTNVLATAAGDENSFALVGDGPPLLRAAIMSPARTANGFSLALPTQNGRVYRLEYKNSLDDSLWTALPLVAGNGSMLTLTDPNATSAQRFYRVRRW